MSTTIIPNNSIISETEELRKDVNQLQENTVNMLDLMRKSNETSIRSLKAIRDTLQVHENRFSTITDTLESQHNVMDKVIGELEDLDDIVCDFIEECSRLRIQFLVLAGTVLIEAVIIALICFNGGA